MPKASGPYWPSGICPVSSQATFVPLPTLSLLYPVSLLLPEVSGAHRGTPDAAASRPRTSENRHASLQGVGMVALGELISEVEILLLATLPFGSQCLVFLNLTLTLTKGKFPW